MGGAARGERVRLAGLGEPGGAGAQGRGGGPRRLEGPSSYLMKSPPVQVPDPVAREDTERFIAEHSKTQRAARFARKAAEEAAEDAAATASG